MNCPLETSPNWRLTIVILELHRKHHKRRCSLTTLSSWWNGQHEHILGKAAGHRRKYTYLPREGFCECSAISQEDGCLLSYSFYAVSHPHLKMKLEFWFDFCFSFSGKSVSLPWGLLNRVPFIGVQLQRVYAYRILMTDQEEMPRSIRRSRKKGINHLTRFEERRKYARYIIHCELSLLWEGKPNSCW